MLLEKLKLDAGEPVFEKAVAYYKAIAIKSFNYTQTGGNCYQLKAIVKGSSAFGVNLKLNFTNDQLKVDPYCTCASGNNSLCEHATAVVYKFLADDFPKLNPVPSKPALSAGIELLKQAAAAPVEKAALVYEIGGLDRPAEHFSYTLTVPDGDEALISQLVDCLGNVNYSVRKREQLFNSFTSFDAIIIAYLEQTYAAKDAARKKILLPKSKSNLQLIQVLAQNGRAILPGSFLPLEMGERLKPTVTVTGDETCLQFTANLTEFEMLGFFDPVLNYVIFNNTLQVIDTTLANLPPQIVIAPEQLGEVLFGILPQLHEKIPLDLAPIFSCHQLVMHQPEIRLNLDYDQERISCQPEITLLNEVYRCRDCQRLLTLEPNYERSPLDPKQWFTINRQPFQELLAFLRRYQFEFTVTGWIITGQDAQLQFMRTGLATLAQKWPLTAGPGLTEFKITPVKLEPLVELKLDEKIDWFDFKIYYNLGGKTYTHQQIRSMLKRFDSGNYLQIGNQWFLIDELTKFDLLNKTLSPKTGSMDPEREQLYNLAFLREVLTEHDIEIKGNGVYDQFETDITHTGPIQASPLPESLQGELRSYQKAGYDWLHFLHKYHFGGILADDMGLGKTIQVLTLIKSLAKPEPVLIICPRSLIYNWAAEINKFYPGTAYLIYHGSPETRALLRPAFSESEIIITTYDLVVNDIETLRDSAFYYCILDEAQHIKNQQTQRAKDCKRIRTRYRLVLTGTPVENRLEDLWALFDFLMPGYLGSQPEFKEKYVIPLKKPNSSETLTLLRKRVAPFMLRRLKEDVLTELPPKIHFIRDVAMTQLQEDVYRTILQQVKQDILNSVANLGLNKSRLTVLSALTKLRQVCDHPSLALPEISATADSGKIEALLELINEAIDGNHRMVIFSQFVKMLKLIRTKLQDAKINYAYLDGSTTDRNERIDCFNHTPEIPVFLISLKAGGEGINLTAADIVIHADPWWNPMVENQATDRVYRMGQQKPVMVYKLITLGTVEEKLIHLQNRKKAIFDAIIQNQGDPVGSLTWEEIKELFEIAE